MKKITTVGFILFFLSLNQSVIATSWWWPPTNETKIIPENPTTTDNVTITLSGNWPTTCTPTNETILVVGNNIYFDVTGNSVSSRVCESRIVPWTKTKIVGRLSKGTYFVYARLTGDPCVPQTYTIVKEFLVDDNPPLPTTYYIDANNGNNNNDGLGPETAFATIQKGIDTAHGGDTVIVTPGTYTGIGNCNIVFNGKAITLKSENGPNECIIDCQNGGIPFTLKNDESSSTRIIGITILNGSQILCNPGSPIINNCIFESESGQLTGGVRCLEGSNPIISNCVFSGQSGKRGNQVYIAKKSKPTINKCIFKGGEQTAIACKDGAYTNCPIISNCIIYDIYATAPFHAPPAIWLEEAGSSTIVQNCLIFNNYSNRWAAGIWCTRSDVTIKNCTIVGNKSQQLGGGIGCYGADPIISNTIIWGNEAPNGPQIVLMSGSHPSITYCDIQGGWSGTGNININPLFLNEANLDFHLQPSSKCINSGNPNYVAEVNETDLDGNLRVIGGRVDLGAYEFDSRPIANAGTDQVAYAYIDGIADVNLDGSDSNDPDGDELTYKWTWTIDSNTYEANGVNPIIGLPVGMHTIELVVNDGINDSLPDYLDVNVIAPVKAGLEILPQTINIASHGRWVWIYMVLPKGFNAKDVDTSWPLVMEPLGVKSKSMNVFTIFRRYVCITAAFDRDDVCGNIKTGRQQISIVGQFKTGQYFFGSDIIRVIGKKK